MKRALMVWGGWDGHEPEQCVTKVGAWLQENGFDVTISDTLQSFEDEAALRAYDLIVPCWTMGEIAQNQVTPLLNAVASGVGLGGWHGGMGDAFRSNCDYQFMVGGQFVAHPGNIYEYSVHIANQDHPITKGLGDFKITSEHYYMHVDPSNEVLVTTVDPGIGNPFTKGAVLPQVWTRKWGEGKVFYSAFGHVAADLDVPEVRELTVRGLVWAAR